MHEDEFEQHIRGDQDYRPLFPQPTKVMSRVFGREGGGSHRRIKARHSSRTESCALPTSQPEGAILKRSLQFSGPPLGYRSTNCVVLVLPLRAINTATKKATRGRPQHITPPRLQLPREGTAKPSKTSEVQPIPRQHPPDTVPSSDRHRGEKKNERCIDGTAAGDEKQAARSYKEMSTAGASKTTMDPSPSPPQTGLACKAPTTPETQQVQVTAPGVISSGTVTTEHIRWVTGLRAGRGRWSSEVQGPWTETENAYFEFVYELFRGGIIGGIEAGLPLRFFMSELLGCVRGGASYFLEMILCS